MKPSLKILIQGEKIKTFSDFRLPFERSLQLPKDRGWSIPSLYDSLRDAPRPLEIEWLQASETQKALPQFYLLLIEMLQAFTLDANETAGKPVVTFRLQP